MTLEIGRTDTRRGEWKLTVLLGVSWVIWASLLSVLRLPSWLDLSMVPIVILWGAVLWGPVAGGVLILGFAWIYRAVSVMPPGVFWLSSFILFILVKLALSQLSLERVGQIFGLMVSACLMWNVLNWIFIARLYPEWSFSWTLLGGLVLSSFIQGALGLILAPAILMRTQAA